MILSIALASVFILWLGLMLTFPDKWNNLVEKENAFWANKGWVSEATADKFVRFEKGMGLKITLIITIIISLANLWFLT